MKDTREARDINYNFVAGRQLVSESEVDKVRVRNWFCKRYIRVHYHLIVGILLRHRVFDHTFFIVGAKGVC